jgi:Ca2+-binding RTX toxin-like protein
MHGGDGDDDLHAGPGSDILNGGPGNDLLREGDDDDFTKYAGKRDILNGGSGDDRLSLTNTPAAKDIASCGDGFDEVRADSADRVASDCERVTRN